MPKSKKARAQLREWLRTGVLPSDPLADHTLGEEARRQGLSGLLHASVLQSRSPWLPGEREVLARAHRDSLVRGVRQLDMAARAQRILAGQEIRSLPLKGAAVAETLYPSVADRPMADVDLLALDDPPTALRLLETQGFREISRADHAVALRDPMWGSVLELHHSVTSCPGLFPLDKEGLWARSQAATGQIARIPAMEDLLLHLSLHAAFQHGLVLSLIQWLDFRRLLERAPVDSDKLLELAGRSFAGAALAASLLAAEAVVGAPLPEALRLKLQPFRAGLGRWLQERLLRPLALVSPAEPALARARWQLSSGRRLALLRRTLGSGARTPGRPVRSAARLLERAAGLLGRWALPSLRAWKPTH
jgi:hypothetical protein